MNLPHKNNNNDIYIYINYYLYMNIFNLIIIL